MALGELGRLKLRSLIDKRIVSCWCNLMSDKKSKLSTTIYWLCKKNV